MEIAVQVGRRIWQRTIWRFCSYDRVLRALEEIFMFVEPDAYRIVESVRSRSMDSTVETLLHMRQDVPLPIRKQLFL